MYFFSVGAIFRNESHCIKEWIEHYLNQDAEHFYLIDDHSTDDFMVQIKPYIERNLITLYTSDNPPPHYYGFQRDTYNKYILPHVNNKDTKWLLMCDLDEFIWTPVYKKLNILLLNIPTLAQVQVPPTIFGSNNLEKQPISLVKGFTKRSNEVPTTYGSYKYIVNSDYKFNSLNVHHADPADSEHLKKEYFMILDSNFLRLNHYVNQSKDFWINVKCKRGDSNGYLERDMNLFYEWDKQGNQVEDLNLLEVNKDILF